MVLQLRTRKVRRRSIDLARREVLHETPAEIASMHRGTLLAKNKPKQQRIGYAMDLLDAADSSLDTYLAPNGRDELRLRSHFQPIFSLAHRRPVGYEGLIRATRPGGGSVAPLDLLRDAPHGEARTLLDRQCRRLHVRNFLRLDAAHSWLFLNVDPYVASEGRRFGAFFAQMLESSGMPAHRVAIELVETPHEDEESLSAAIEYYRELGCLIVIDDFGAGSSNFDRIWRLKPDIVKIDREMTRRVTVDPLARRVFMGIVAVLHEAGALVCVEGIETEAEALCATAAEADLVQGYYFARPSAERPREQACRELFARLNTAFRAESTRSRDRRGARLEPYFAALSNAARGIQDGADHSQAARALLGLDCTQRCYLIASDGFQIGANLEAERNVSARNPRLEPMRPTPGTSWQSKAYFRRALCAPGRIQITRPYLSVTGPRLCVTLSLAFQINQEIFVLCVDLDLRGLDGDDLAYGIDETGLPAPEIAGISDTFARRLHLERVIYRGRAGPGSDDLASFSGMPL